MQKNYYNSAPLFKPKDKMATETSTQQVAQQLSQVPTEENIENRQTSEPLTEEPKQENTETQPETQPETPAAETDPEFDSEQNQPGVDFSDEEARLAAAALDTEEDSEMEDDSEPQNDRILPDLSSKTKTELVDMLEKLLAEKPVQSLRNDIEAIKIAFYKKHRAEIETAKKAFVDAGGSADEFAPSLDAQELRLKDLIAEYRRRRDEFLAGLEQTKQENLKIKLEIIEELKKLIGGGETVGQTFSAFRELQTRWKETGPVPQANVKDLWETYNLYVENFYGFIKINKELRDLDLKRNFETKTSLCEQAEALLLEPSIVEAFHKLQKLHEEWRETGPVASEYKEQLWERFKEASTRINKQHQQYFDDIKAEQKKNLELKTGLCEQAEELSAAPLTSRKEWNKASAKLLEIQKVWKTIGFAPKKDNTRIYERFRAACDSFFEHKRTFYVRLKEEMEHNLQLKTEICQAAEQIMNSEEWKKTSDELIALQKRWKEIGTVPRRYSDAVWKRFRAACDTFFENKAKHFSSVDEQYKTNLESKRALLVEMTERGFENMDFETIKNFQRRWSEIGFVPIKYKDAIQKEYKEVVDKLFAALRGEEQQRGMERFREKVSSMKSSGDKRLRQQRDKLYNKVRQLESEIALLENNIGFFSRSKNAESMIRDVKEKIEKAKAEMNAAIEKIKLIDEQE